jgi:peptidoglycan/xylan/chitin deacetylase (PgdA/CDA1 family)
MDTRSIVPVLLYHRIAWSANDRYAVSPSSFASHLQAILGSGRTPLTISELAEFLRGTAAMKRKYIAITFDDGYAETLEAVVALTDLGLKATVYVTTGLIGSLGMLTPEQVQTLASMQGVEVGAHTVSHPYLDELGRTEVEQEVVRSRQTLQALGCMAGSFAYPHGAYDASVRAAVIEAGFGSAAGVKNALSHGRDDPWAIARYTVSQSTSLKQVTRLLEGRGAPLAWTHERLRTRAYRVARRFGRRVSFGTRF